MEPRLPADMAGPDEKSSCRRVSKEREASNGFCEGGTLAIDICQYRVT